MVPFPPPAWVEAKVLEIVHQSVPTTYEAVTTLARVQNQHLIARGCCGTNRVQHLWQTVNPTECYTAVDSVDGLSAFAIAGIWGKMEVDIPALVWMQIFLPQRFGGCGYRKSAHTHMLSYVGAFAMAAYNDSYNIANIAPFLADDVNSPETSALPSLQAVYGIWGWMYESNQFDRFWALSKAAVAGVVRPPTDDPELQDPDTWPRQLSDQESRYETRFKAQAVKGTLVAPADDASYLALTTEIYDRAEQEKGDSYAHWSPLRKRQYDTPQEHPSLLRTWSEQGGEKFQKLLSRHQDMHRFNHFVSVLTAERGMEGLALFRAKINAFATVPLTILPNKPERKFGNDAFQWYLNDRVQMVQPSSASISAQNCNCHLHPVVGNGRHFRICPYTSTQSRFHDSMRDTLIRMVSAAGLTVQREPKGKLPAEPELRPGDLCISDWTVDGIVQTEHCIDFAAPVVNGNWSHLHNDEKLLRSCVVGVAGKRIEDIKSAKKGTKREQEDRGDDFSMKERCRLQHINFWPVAIEVDGAITSSFLRFFNNVCDAASNLTEQNRAAFQHYWSKRIACDLHQQNARLSLQRAASLRRHLRRLPVTSDDVLQYHQLQTELPSSVSDRSEFRDRQRNFNAARRVRQRRRML